MEYKSNMSRIKTVKVYAGKAHLVEINISHIHLMEYNE